jgi:hypothetical protein
MTMGFEIGGRYLVRRGDGRLQEVYCTEVSPEGRVALLFSGASYAVWLDKQELESLQIVEKLPNSHEKQAGDTWNRTFEKRFVRE